MGIINNKHLKGQVFEKVVITGVGAEGKAIARHNDMIIFLNFGARGDVVDVEIIKIHRRYMEGRIIKIHEKSPSRTEPFCEHYGICGGCRWQHLVYDEQLRLKQTQVTDSTERIGGIKYPYELLPLKGSEKILFYRNKLEYTFANRGWLISYEKSPVLFYDNPDLQALGFHVPGFSAKCWISKNVGSNQNHPIRSGLE